MTYTFVVTYFLVTIMSACVCLVVLRRLAPDMGTEQEVHAFRNYLIGILLFMLSNSVWVWINYGYLHFPGWIFSMVNLIAICVASYFWFKYIELRLNPHIVDTIPFKIVSLLPLLVAIVLVVTTPLTGLVFYYNELNQYIHGPLYSTMAVLAILYLLVASVHIAFHLSKVHTPSERSQYITLMLFLVFPVAGGIIDILIPNLPIMELTLVFGTVLVFTSMQQSRINSDVLTGLYNRRLSDDFLLEQLEDASEENPVYFFIADIDNFKEINDEFGHPEGDRALRLIAQAITDATSDIPCHIARWGGDEFVIIVRGRYLPDPNELVGKLTIAIDELVSKEQLPYPLSISHGYTKVNSKGITPAEVLHDADEKMYSMKRRHRIWSEVETEAS